MGGAHEWVEIGIHRAADELWAQGELEHFIIALPEGGMLTYWLNHANDGPRYEDYLLQDVVGEIDATHRTIPDARHRAVGGLSMGGEGALRLALSHPEVFGIAGAHSPTTRLKYEDRPGAFFGDLEYWQRNNSLWLAKHAGVPAGLKVWIDVGEADPWVFSARELHKALNDRDVEHRYAENAGTHEAEYWTANLPDYLRFYASAFGSQALAGGAGVGE
jgi:S-formylglutathione hydrolase FrmB